MRAETRIPCYGCRSSAALRGRRSPLLSLMRSALHLSLLADLERDAAAVHRRRLNNLRLQCGGSARCRSLDNAGGSSVSRQAWRRAHQLIGFRRRRLLVHLRFQQLESTSCIAHFLLVMFCAQTSFTMSRPPHSSTPQPSHFIVQLTPPSLTQPASASLHAAHPPHHPHAAAITSALHPPGHVGSRPLQRSASFGSFDGMSRVLSARELRSYERSDGLTVENNYDDATSEGGAGQFGSRKRPVLLTTPRKMDNALSDRSPIPLSIHTIPLDSIAVPQWRLAAEMQQHRAQQRALQDSRLPPVHSPLSPPEEISSGKSSDTSALVPPSPAAAA